MTRRVTEQAIAEATTPPTIVSAEQRRVTIKNERAVPYERPRRATTAAKRDIENLDTYIEFLDYMRNRPEHNFHHEWSFKEKVWLIILSKLFANLDINGKIRVDWKNGLRIIPLTNVKTHALIMSHWYSYRRSLKSNSWKCADRIAEKLLTENSEYFYQLKRGN